jgi:hypothetical protein
MRGGFAPNLDGTKSAERALRKANFAFGLEFFQYFGEGKLATVTLAGRAYFCDWLPAIRDQQGLTVADSPQISSEAVFEFAAADLLHVATSLTIVATKERAGNQRLSFRLRPTKEEADPSLRSG